MADLTRRPGWKIFKRRSGEWVAQPAGAKKLRRYIMWDEATRVGSLKTAKGPIKPIGQFNSLEEVIDWVNKQCLA